MSQKKVPLYISIFGQPGSGKTTAMQLIQKIFRTLGIEVQASWSQDGPPNAENPPNTKILSVAEKVRVILVETQKRKFDRERHESPDDFRVGVQYLPGPGYCVYVSVLGTVLRHDFGDKFPVLKERARATAIRLANELGVDVIDELPTDIDPFRQAKNFNPNGDS